MSEQLTLDFAASSTQRRKRAKKRADAVDQPTLFAAWAPNLDIHLHSPAEAIAQISGPEPERAHDWLAGVVGNIRELKTRRVAFSTSKLDRLLYIRPPAQVTLDAAATAVGRALWADKLNLPSLKVTRDSQRLLASSRRWPRGFNVTDAPWTAIAAIVHIGLPIDVAEDSRKLLRRKLEQAGTKVGVAGLAGSAVIIETRRPEIVENMGLPGLAYAGEKRAGTYKLPLLSAGPLLNQKSIEVPAELRAAIENAVRPVKPLSGRELGPDFPWTLYGFQADDAATAIRILETTGGAILAGDMGSGKMVASRSLVLTPTGPVVAKTVEVGDYLVGRDGRPALVTGVFPQGIWPMYDVTFTDGRTIAAGPEHLWSVKSSPQGFTRGAGEVLTTQQLVDSRLRDDAGNLRWYIPMCEPIHFAAAKPLPVDPYVLGQLLGGDRRTATSVTFTSDEDLVIDALRRGEPDGELAAASLISRQPERRSKDESPDTSDGDGLNDRFLKGPARGTASKVADLGGKPARAKAVPSEYLYAPLEHRRSLLQGLLDTAGEVMRYEHQGSIEFSSPSEPLVDAVRWLAESLGGTGRKSAPRSTAPTISGDKTLDGPNWRLSLAFPAGERPFRQPGKVARYADVVMHQPVRGIKSIEPAPPEDAICFQVATDDHLFLGEGAVCLHNTTVSLGIAQYMSIWPILIVAPLSAFSTWQRQLGEMGRKTYLATGSMKKAWAEIEHGDYDAIVLSYDRLPAFTELVERMPFRGIIADEIQRIRSAGSRRSRALRALAASVPLRIGLSGTPLTNSVTDLLPVGAFLSPGEWRPRASSKDLEDIYPGGDPVEAVAEHLGSLMVRRRMEDTGAKLPKRNDHRVYVELTAEQRKALADLEAEAEKAKQAGEFDDPKGRFHAFAKLQKQRQIINSPRAAGIGGVNPKVAAALTLAKDFLAQGRKGVLFCADRTTFRELGEALDANSIGWVGIWGSTPPGDRIKHERMFHENATAPNGHPTDVVLCTIQAGSESWSASPTATWLISTAYMYAPATLNQMECRVYRLNSDPDGPPIEICYTHAKAPGGTLDDRMVEILEVKKELFAQVVDRASFQDKTKVHLSMGDLMYLLTGQRDEHLDKLEADNKAAAAREQAQKDHAKRTLYKHKRGNADLVLDDGAQAITREEHDQLEDLLDAAESDDLFDVDDQAEDVDYDTGDDEPDAPFSPAGTLGQS